MRRGGTDAGFAAAGVADVYDFLGRRLDGDCGEEEQGGLRRCSPTVLRPFLRWRLRCGGWRCVAIAWELSRSRGS